MNFFVKLSILLFLAQAASSAPQFFGQTFSSSSFVGPNGQVVQSSIYTDSDGNRLVNGLPFQQNVIPAPAPPPAQPQPQVQAQAKPQAKPASSSAVNSGQYVHDDSGKWKGN